MYVMKRTTLFIDQELLHRAQQAARERGISFARMVREALVAYLAPPDEVREAGALPSVTARFASGRADTAERVDELLWREPHG